MLARRWPPRLDVSARADFPPAARLRLAQQIRQDIWRALQHLRGFAPVIVVTRTNAGLVVEAGGQLAGPVQPDLSARIAAILADPALRRRWLAYAKPRSNTEHPGPRSGGRQPHREGPQ